MNSHAFVGIASFVVLAAIGPASPALCDVAPVYLLKWGSAGTGPGQFNRAFGIAVDPTHHVYVSDQTQNRIQKFTSEGVFVIEWGGTGAGPGQFNAPQGLACDADGNVYVVDRGNARIQVFTGAGAFVRQWGGPGNDLGQFLEPQGIALDGAGNVYVMDSGHYSVQKFTSSGSFLGKWGGFSQFGDPGTFNTPEYIGVASDGTHYVSDFGKIQKWTASGQFLFSWNAFDFAEGVAVDASGNVFVAQNLGGTVAKFSSTGALLAQFGSSGSGDGQFGRPMAIAIDGDFVYVTDWPLCRVQKFGPADTTPALRTTWGRIKSLYR